ncbi:hypothetical protein [Burkholderia aenigmatica]|uniref:hypothetical protein n=1 Tax=Burkholderia aenigmatica TaxID=2015348 RepID=UPI0026546DFE|nr:hypothetical protein [Burkholderia aenigmatica]MDN7881375.1 hypothetical protein [Burkholderia aenigmatica]
MSPRDQKRTGNVIDFTKPGWGHALHGDTFRAKRAESWVDRFVDKLRSRRRYTVLFHCSRNIAPGDRIRYATRAGIAEAHVVSVDWFLDPHDMGRLEILMVEVSR